ncbi:hypothetical protein STEG23_004415, partial [Scotinomys teguina]
MHLPHALRTPAGPQAAKGAQTSKERFLPMCKAQISDDRADEVTVCKSGWPDLEFVMWTRNLPYVHHKNNFHLFNKLCYQTPIDNTLYGKKYRQIYDTNNGDFSLTAQSVEYASVHIRCKVMTPLVRFIGNQNLVFETTVFEQESLCYSEEDFTEYNSKFAVNWLYKPTPYNYTLDSKTRIKSRVPYYILSINKYMYNLTYSIYQFIHPSIHISYISAGQAPLDWLLTDRGPFHRAQEYADFMERYRQGFTT